MLIQPLEWDSTFFDLKVGIIKVETFDLTRFLAEYKKFDVVYIFEKPDSKNNNQIQQFCPNPIDVKITCKKAINHLQEINENIHIYQYEENSFKELASLAVQSGLYSRFKLDENFPKNSFERLYLKWIKNEINSSHKLPILVYKEENKMEGFISLSTMNNQAHISLFAVDAQHREKGIGKKLLVAAEHYALKNHFQELFVSTQSINQPANSLYKKQGFEENYNVNVYHVWNK